MSEKREHPKEKTKLHPRNRNRTRYNFTKLISSYPDLEQYVKLNRYDDLSIDFFDPKAVTTLNKALLKHYYKIDNWDIPENYLSPPIPGRADYIHYIADLLAESNKGKVPAVNKIKGLDIGVGANCIYPIIGNVDYGWRFVGSDIDETAIESARKIINSNKSLKGNVRLKVQHNPKNIFYNIIGEGEKIDFTICNPPFHSSKEEAQEGTLRKLKSISNKKVTKATLNFGGQSNELWCKGGEKKFVRDMIRQSTQFAKSCLWFTTLISKQSNLKSAYEALKNAGVKEFKTIEMGQGTKSSRIIAWTFLGKEQRLNWARDKWNTK